MRYLILLIVILSMIGCSLKKTISRNETKDSLVIIRHQKDTVKIVEQNTVTVPVNHYIELACDSSSFKQDISVGKNFLSIEKKLGKVQVIYKQDSLFNRYKSLYFKQLKIRDSILKIKKSEIIYEKKTSVRLLDTIYKVLFFIILLLWVFGITPKYLIKKLIGIY